MCTRSKRVNRPSPNCSSSLRDSGRCVLMLIKAVTANSALRRVFWRKKRFNKTKFLHKVSHLLSTDTSRRHASVGLLLYAALPTGLSIPNVMQLRRENKVSLPQRASHTSCSTTKQNLSDSSKEIANKRTFEHLPLTETDEKCTTQHSEQWNRLQISSCWYSRRVWHPGSFRALQPCHSVEEEERNIDDVTKKEKEKTRSV